MIGTVETESGRDASPGLFTCIFWFLGILSNS